MSRLNLRFYVIMKINKNNSFCVLNDAQMKNIKGGFLWWTAMQLGYEVAMKLKEKGTFDSGSMSEEEYANWFEGLTGTEYESWMGGN